MTTRFKYPDPDGKIAAAEALAAETGAEVARVGAKMEQLENEQSLVKQAHRETKRSLACARWDSLEGAPTLTGYGGAKFRVVRVSKGGTVLTALGRQHGAEDARLKVRPSHGVGRWEKKRLHRWDSTPIYTCDADLPNGWTFGDPWTPIDGGAA